MSDNQLDPGNAGLPAPAEGDSRPNPLAAPAPSGPSPMMQHYGGKQDAAAAQFDKVMEIKGQAEATRAALDTLVAMADTVTQEDVVKAAGKMVAAGVAATQVASELADMPPNGEALRAWVAEKDQQAAENEQKLAALVASAQYQLGSSALKHVIAYSAESHALRLAGNGSIH